MNLDMLMAAVLMLVALAGAAMTVAGLWLMVHDATVKIMEAL